MEATPCRMHRSLSPGPYRLHRCLHRDNRYVVETRHDSGVYFAIDYVERRGDGSTLVEVHNVTDEPSAEGLWAELVGMLKADVPPRDERGTM